MLLEKNKGNSLDNLPPPIDPSAISLDPTTALIAASNVGLDDDAALVRGTGGLGPLGSLNMVLGFGTDRSDDGDSGLAALADEKERLSNEIEDLMGVGRLDGLDDLQSLERLSRELRKAISNNDGDAVLANTKDGLDFGRLIAAASSNTGSSHTRRVSKNDLSSSSRTKPERRRSRGKGGRRAGEAQEDLYFSPTEQSTAAVAEAPQEVKKKKKSSAKKSSKKSANLRTGEKTAVEIAAMFGEAKEENGDEEVEAEATSNPPWASEIDFADGKIIETKLKEAIDDLIRRKKERERDEGQSAETEMSMSSMSFEPYDLQLDSSSVKSLARSPKMIDDENKKVSTNSESKDSIQSSPVKKRVGVFPFRESPRMDFSDWWPKFERSSLIAPDEMFPGDSWMPIGRPISLDFLQKR